MDNKEIDLAFDSIRNVLTLPHKRVGNETQQEWMDREEAGKKIMVAAGLLLLSNFLKNVNDIAQYMGNEDSRRTL